MFKNNEQSEGFAESKNQFTDKFSRADTFDQDSVAARFAHKTLTAHKIQDAEDDLNRRAAQAAKQQNKKARPTGHEN